MEKVPAELMKEYVNSQKFTSTTEIMEAMKAMFGDVLQQVMEAELDTKLGYEKSERTSNDDENGLSKNYRNGHSKKTVKTQLGEVTINVPRDRNGEYEPSIIGKYNRNADGMEEKILSLYSCGMSQRDISEQIKVPSGVYSCKPPHVPIRTISRLFRLSFSRRVEKSILANASISFMTISILSHPMPVDMTLMRFPR